MGVLAHPLRPNTFPVAEGIENTLKTRGLKTYLFTEWTVDDIHAVIEDIDIVIAIGGDGAMLRAARVCAPFKIPVLGINMGQLGFLTEIPTINDWENMVDRVLEQDYWIEERMMIRAEILDGDNVLHQDDALNDVVVSGNAIGKMVQLEVFIDGDWTTSYYADALVISTATGSTAYALATGGPILPPELKNILIVPAAPHLSMDRPIVLSEGAEVVVQASTHNRNKIMVTADGVRITELFVNKRVRIRVSDHVTRFIRLRGRNYFYRSLLDRLEPRVRRDGLEHNENTE